MGKIQVKSSVEDRWHSRDILAKIFTPHIEHSEVSGTIPIEVWFLVRVGVGICIRRTLFAICVQFGKRIKGDPSKSPGIHQQPAQSKARLRRELDAVKSCVFRWYWCLGQRADRREKRATHKL
jgi:hypothetical protein